MGKHTHGREMLPLGRLAAPAGSAAVFEWRRTVSRIPGRVISSGTGSETRPDRSSAMPYLPADFRCWPVSAAPTVGIRVRYWGRSCRGSERQVRQLLTHRDISGSSFDALRKDYSITSSARASNEAGKVRPSALAVFRLTVSWYLVGACTGRSAGFSPLRMRST
jgi:hypothetical protein